jgi:hypothetical protein
MSRIRTATRLPPSSFGRKMSQRLLQYTRPGSNSPTASTSPERLRPLPSPAIAILPPTCPHFHPLWWAAGPWDSPEKHVRTPAIFARHSPSSVFSSLLMGRRPMGHSLWSRLGWPSSNGESGFARCFIRSPPPPLEPPHCADDPRPCEAQTGDRRLQ